MTETPRSKLTSWSADAQASVGEHNPMRRIMLNSMIGLVGIAAFAPLVGNAQANQPGKAKRPKDEPFNPTVSRPREFMKGEMNSGKPWIAKQQGNFDLADPAQNNLAKLKMTSNLIGERTYIPMLARMIFARYNEPPHMALGIAGMFTWQAQETDPKEFGALPPGTAVMRSMYTAVYLDPQTMKPVTEVKNSITGKMMQLEDLRFVENFLQYPLGGSRMVGEETFANDAANKPNIATIMNWGDELILYLGGLYSNPGVHQPRLTENNWTSSKAEVMDPDVGLVRTNFSLMGLNKAYEKPWTGFTADDPEFFATLTRGKKVHRADDLPDVHKRVLAERYPHRL